MLVEDDLGRADLRASGTLLRVASESLIITARHVLDQDDPVRLAVPETGRRGRIQTLGTFQIFKPDDPQYDVCVLPETKGPE